MQSVVFGCSAGALRPAVNKLHLRNSQTSWNPAVTWVGFCPWVGNYF